MKKLLSIVLCVLLVIGLIACQGAQQLAVTPPVSGLTWGMTFTEVVAELSEAGLPEEDLKLSTGDEKYLQLLLSEENCKTLNMEDFVGCSFYDSSGSIALHFVYDTLGEAYLDCAYVSVQMNTEEDVKKQLTEYYGPPSDEFDDYWLKSGKIENLTTEPWASILDSVENHTTLILCATDYVKANFGNF